MGRVERLIGSLLERETRCERLQQRIRHVVSMTGPVRAARVEVEQLGGRIADFCRRLLARLLPLVAA
jgi:hypothetical protein